MAKAKVEPEIEDLNDEETAVLMGAADPTPMGGPLRERIGLFRRRAVARLVKQGVARDVALSSVGAFGDGKLLDWIIAHGPDIIAFVKMIMTLFGL